MTGLFEIGFPLQRRRDNFGNFSVFVNLIRNPYFTQPVECVICPKMQRARCEVHLSYYWGSFLY